MRNLRLLSRQTIRSFSVAEASLDVNKRKVLARRAASNDPTSHTADDLGKFYTIPENDRVKLFSVYGFPTQFDENIKTFNETAIMIRQPAFEIISYLKQLDPTRLVNKYVIYGKYGNGKSISMSHIIHYAYQSGFLIVHAPAPSVWLKWSKEVCLSTSKPPLVNLPIDSAQWLKNFRISNAPLLSKLDLRTSQKYVWSQREVTEENVPLLDLIDHGISRIRYSDDVIDCLFDELKKFSTQKKCKTLVAVDGFNAFYNEKTHLMPEDRSEVNPRRLCLVQSFLKLTTADWANGAIVLTVDERAAFNHQRESVYPLYLLSKEGFEHLDPFIPVPVEELSFKEFNNMLDFYEEKKWLLKPEGRREIEFLSTKNPYQIAELCGPL